MRTDRLLVVVPAHDEEQVLDACLDHLEVAARAVAARAAVRVVVVLDDCTDASAALARAHDVEVVTASLRNVGAARALGVEAAAHEVTDATRAWVASTDADSRVGPGWLRDHLAAADAGHDLLLGRVRPDPADLLPHVVREWHRRHHRAGGHVHGANLGVRLSAYRSAGGFPPLPTGEDVALVEALLAGGARVARGGTAVTTSGRTRGRAPAGFATYLAALTTDTAPARTP